MIDQLMKTVKRGNKKRSLNITIGAVVGFLLSCTGVMGTDNYLWIKDNGNGIEFNTEKTIDIDGKDGIWKNENPYSENTWNAGAKTYVNNITLLSSENNGKYKIGNNVMDISYGLRLSGNLSGLNFINNNSITGTGNDSSSGIYNNGKIGALTNSGSIAGTGTGNDSSSGIYNYGEIVALTNSGSITGTGNGHGSGIYNSGEIGILTNSGSITGKGTGTGNDYGIYNTDIGKIETLTNSGSITGTGTGNSSGISNYSEIGVLTNNGSIAGTGKGYGSGIDNNGKIGVLTNNGSIAGTGNGYASGIDTYGEIEFLIVNSGSIAGTGKGYGIFSYDKIGTVTNTGVIYGNTNAINNKEGSINSAYNYGILANGTDSSVIGGILTVVNAAPDTIPALSPNEILNRGLIFKVVGAGYKVEKEEYQQFGTIHKDKDIIVGYEKDNNGNIDLNKPIMQKYTIINAKATVNNENDITEMKSLELKNGNLSYYENDILQTTNISSEKRYVLNGITDTLKVTGKRNELNNSVVNAYKTAIVMEGDRTYLELNNTIVNGGLDDISSAISVKGDKNFLTIKGDTIVNGEIKSEGSLNTLNLYGKENKSRSVDTESMNILNDIIGFGRIQVENDVTFSETAKVTGVERININNGGTLNLRLKKDEKGVKAIHALSGGNTDLLIAGLEKGGSSTEGTLNFITNGMGTDTVIDMGGAELENVNLKTSSIIYELEVVDTKDSNADVGDIKLGAVGSLGGIVNGGNITFDEYLLPDETKYNSLDKIYQSTKTDENMDALVEIIDSSSNEEQWERLLSFLGGIYTGTPYSFSSELSRKSMGMFRDIVTENHFRPDLNKWMIMGGLTHGDGGTKDTYYGKNYYGIDTGTADTDVDMKLSGAYALGKYGYSENVSLGITAGGNRSEAELSMSKVKGNSGYIGVFTENYRGNLTLKAGGGIQYSEYDADRRTIGGYSYDEKYSDMAYDIYLNGRYSHNIGNNLFLEPYGTLSYTYIKQDGADERNKVLAIETDSKSFDYTAAKVGVDIKKVIPHEKGKSTLSAGVSYTRILDGADEEYITGRFKGGSDFDILVAHKNEHSIGLNAKYALELENGILFNVKGTYAVERDSHNGTGKNKTKGEWIVGAGLGYEF